MAFFRNQPHSTRCIDATRFLVKKERNPHQGHEGPDEDVQEEGPQASPPSNWVTRAPELAARYATRASTICFASATV